MDKSTLGKYVALEISTSFLFGIGLGFYLGKLYPSAGWLDHVPYILGIVLLFATIPFYRRVWSQFK